VFSLLFQYYASYKSWILYLISFYEIMKESVISSLKELLGDAAVGSNPTLRLIAGTVFLHEQDFNEALKHTHSGGTLEL
jgi:Coatomer epsilon subunit